MVEDDRDNPSGDGRDDANTVHVSPALSHTHAHRRHEPPLYGVMAEFEGPNELVAAARQTYEAGYRRINGYSPYPIEELSEAIGFTQTSLPLIVFIGGVLGGLGQLREGGQNLLFRKIDIFQSLEKKFVQCFWLFSH